MILKAHLDHFSSFLCCFGCFYSPFVVVVFGIDYFFVVDVSACGFQVLVPSEDLNHERVFDICITIATIENS
jgi:hypothetical protein